jgi:beta-glucuronidase
MGANFVRLAHYPHEEFMTREAERLGLLVWSEIPVYWMVPYENPDTYENARNQLAESIQRDKNRASVILWSVANETPINDARNTFLTKLATEARRLDPTRLITAAMLHRSEGDTQILQDPMGEVLDVLGCNEYIGWYGGTPESAERVEWKNPYNKPLIMSEFGGDAPAGLHGEADARWTEEYQESIYEHTVKMFKKIPFLAGTSPWILMDFRSPRRLLPGVQDYFNRKGLISDRGSKKKAFFVMQRYYRELAAAEK